MRKTEELYRVLIATAETTMRGYDYRGHERGVTLIIDRPFGSQRDSAQGLARTGRFGEPTKRYITHATPLVDDKRKKDQAIRLIAF